jgi:hypothetical protein
MNLSLRQPFIRLISYFMMFTPALLLGEVKVVNIIPKSLSDETNQDSEPNLAVNPANSLQIAASAFTPDPLGGKTAPIFVSADGGKTWSLNSILPSETFTADITLRFGGSSNTLYAAILRQPVINRQPELVICRTTNFTDTKPMDELVTRRGKGVDQPYIAALTIAGKDKVFIGDNDLNDRNGHTASIDWSLDSAAAPAPAGFSSPVRLETRATFRQDGPQVRITATPDGKTLYGIFYRWTNFDGNYATVDIVVVKDSNGGAGRRLFADLNDPQDNSPGVRVATKRKLPWDSPRLGGERVGGDAAIAVDPRDANTVYIAWTDELEGHYTLHLMRSRDGGLTWHVREPASASQDFRTLVDTKNPGLAINNEGVVGFVYQQVISTDTGQDWVTCFEQTANGFATNPSKIILSRFPVPEVPPTTVPFIGDYLHLMAIGNDFHGIFCASNTPDKANFPSGVIFQRNANFTRKVLLATDNSTVVDPSIDPYYFTVMASTAH